MNVVIDTDNGLADVDALISVRDLGEHLSQRGYHLPLPQPWPDVSLAQLALTAPIVVEALVQRAQLSTRDGMFDTPKAPRHSAGPSLLHLCCGPLPMAQLVRAHVRVVHHREAQLSTVRVDDVVSYLVREADLARAIYVCADSTTITTLSASAQEPSSLNTPTSAWTTARAIVAGDAHAMRAALDVSGARVLLFPFMQRAAVLTTAPSTSGPTTRAKSVDVKAGARALAQALSR